MTTKKEVILPDIGDCDSVEVIEVLVSIGDIVKENSSIITLENDKATMEIPAPFSGKVTNISIKVGDKVSQGDLILTLEVSSDTSNKEESVPEAHTSENRPIKTIEQEIQKESVDTPIDANADKIDETISLNTSDDSHASPSIRKLARELGASLSNIKGTGPKGRIIEVDLKGYVKQIVAGGILPEEIESVPLSRIKKISGKHLSHCWETTPHVTQFDEVNIEQMEKFRKHQKERGIKLTPLVFIMKAVVQVLKQHPNFNSSLDESGENLLVKKYFNLGVAMDTPEGLVVPVIRDVGKKSLVELADELAEISTRAREGQLDRSEMQGAGFTVSSLGGIGGTHFTPIINSPEVAILGISRTQIKPRWNGKTFEPTAMLPVSLSYDHRVVDGADGAALVQGLKKLLEHPISIL